MKAGDRVRITDPSFACADLEGVIEGVDVYGPGTFLVRIDGDSFPVELRACDFEVIR